LRAIAEKSSDKEVVQCVTTGKYDKDKINDQEAEEIMKCFCFILEKDEIEIRNTDFRELLESMEPTKLLEKFAYRRRDKRNAAEFARIKGEKGQLEENVELTEEENPDFGFKCLHYSVTESAGNVEITVKRKRNTAPECIGVRTQDGTAKAPKDYGAVDQKVMFKLGQEYATV
jgi:hypothetical protein